MTLDESLHRATWLWSPFSMWEGPQAKRWRWLSCRQLLRGAPEGQKMGKRSAHWTRWGLVVLVVVNAGWMVFDGSRALVVGDYVTPKSGRHAGELGPWAEVPQAIGIPPRSPLMKGIFVVYGLVYLAMTAAFFLRVPWGRRGVIIAAVLGLWYLPFGTLINLVVLGLLQLPSLRGGDT